ncbi:hypothetical protein ETB97_008699 [Aspergillus alliaceus]|uniref:Uncharacterized protein n=1 Tax=Petromyces alliaceus TaxID=209559 RepID=A0A5N7C5I9_PETAA|nr:uncharacterized protein BDW43DRAFT_255330 [Aspergillus alliaceus]KAB8227314.1 hypothetical protein BDW43DRAFT_255330 [Aspergillus alliaceus]KAE8389366.1 hypothetical protein BDV23DRAFT_98164 [Aspergillus alliaceus]KAF5866894.1 hypothetical protein ETB97_008699 [Aspergillus burnettii]
MHFYTTLAVGLSILGFTFATPFDDPVQWKVSDFTTSCGSEDCNYNFNIASNASNASGFKTSCTGVPAESDYAPCQDKSTEAKLIPGQYPTWSVHVKHTWYEGEARYTAHGLANVTNTMKSFPIPVTEVYGVL